MKNFVHLGSLALALGLAGLMAGCASNPHNLSQRPRPARDFEVVETSTKRTLNDKEMAFLRAKVADYLDKQGATSGGNYYVKVFLGADQEGVPAEWVIVRFSRDMNIRFELLGSDDNYYPGYGPYAAYDYYPGGYASFSRLSLQYYDDPYYSGGYSMQYYGDPYYSGGYYFPPQRRDNHDRNHDHDGDKDRDHDGDRNHKDDHSRTREPSRLTPGSQVPPPPQWMRTHWDGAAPRPNNLPQDNAGQRHDGSSGRGQSDHSNERSYTPPIRTSSQAAPRTESSSYQSTPSQPSFRTSSQSAPSYSPPAPSYNPPVTRSESSQGSNPNQGSRDSGRSAAEKDKMQ